MWPYLDKCISNSVTDALSPILNDLVANLQGGIALNFSKFTCGREPPLLTAVRRCRLTSG